MYLGRYNGWRQIKGRHRPEIQEQRSIGREPLLHEMRQQDGRIWAIGGMLPRSSIDAILFIKWSCVHAHLYTRAFPRNLCTTPSLAVTASLDNDHDIPPTEGARSHSHLVERGHRSSEYSGGGNLEFLPLLGSFRLSLERTPHRLQGSCPSRIL